MPVKTFSPFRSFLGPWIVLFFLLSQLFRIGEATVPGPNHSSGQVDSFIDPPCWFLPTKPDFCVGTSNPAGISNKLHMLEFFPHGWFHLAETQASHRQQCSFQSRLRSLSYGTGRNLRSCLGAPAALRPGSTFAGTWTGVLNFGDCPLRSIPCVWPNGEFASGRIVMTAAQLGSLEVASATIYCPPVGPTYPRAKQLAEALLEPVTEQLVYGRQGPRLICGDFNAAPGSLKAMKLWQSQGWIELQQLFLETHFRPPEPTCKNSTNPDQIWISPELIPFVINIATWDIFPDHKILLMGLRTSSAPVFQDQWTLPGHIPWNLLDQSAWVSAPDLPSLVPTSLQPEGGEALPDWNFSGAQSFDTTQAFHTWSTHFETQASKCIPGIGKADKSFFGRGRQTKPKRRRVFHAVPRTSRPGELEQASGFLNRAVANWFKQLRRLQSYCHAVKSQRSQDNFLSRAILWQSILRAHGFQAGFPSWWLSRPVQLQGSPARLPDYPPQETEASQIFEDFTHNYRRFEHWQMQRRQDSCKSKVMHSTSLLFLASCKPAKAPIDTLEDSFDQSIQVVDAHRRLVKVPELFPEHGVSHWSHQGQPALVKQQGDCLELDSDLLLLEGQTLTCHITVHDTNVIHDRLAALWTSRWNKHKDTPPQAWDQICAFAKDHLPTGDFDLPPVTVQDWRSAAHKFKQNAATGPCGWTRSDLVNMTDSQAAQVLQLFRAIENGAEWPRQWSVGLIHCLEKRPGVKDVNGFRPINVMSLFYRLYSGIRAGQLLSRMTQWADHMQCGFLKNRQASDIWLFVGACLEVSFQQDRAVHGLVADLVKAYNTLPRKPTFEFMSILGFPAWFLDMWSRHLASLTRHFLVRRSAGPALDSSTGFPEGCPLSCVAMGVIDTVWHLFQRIAQPRALTLSYVDNLECVADSLPILLASLGSLRQFCEAMDLELDESALYLWSSDSASRSELRQRGFKVSLGARDLGGQVTYCRQLRNKVLTDRIEANLPYFGTLRTAALPQSVKMSNISQVLLPRSLHGCEATELADGHLGKLRSGTMRAMHWDAPGASPIARISLLNHRIDPGWFQLSHVFETFRRQITANEVFLEWWTLFAQGQDGQKSHGPFTKLLNQAHALGLTIDAQATLWFSERGHLDLRTCTQQQVEKILLHHFFCKQTVTLAKRAGFAGLEGYDAELTAFGEKDFSPTDVALVHKVRDGSFITNHAQSRFDTSKTVQRDFCQVRDDRRHKYTECCKYDHIRSRFGSLFSVWDDLPECFQLQGLIPANPWLALSWEALMNLPDRSGDFAFEPSGHTWHAFTDGSCTPPTEGAISLGAWGVVIADQGTVASGWLPGLQQCILRAECFAVISVLKWVRGQIGDLHLWIDNQTVVQHLRELLSHTATPRDFEHQDLWSTISCLLDSATVDVYLHKVSSHEAQEDIDTPVGDFIFHWNDQADRQASLANQQRPIWFQRIWDRYLEYRTRWKQLSRWHSLFVLEVAKHDCAAKLARQTEDEDLEPVSPIDFERMPNGAALSSHLFRSKDISFSGLDTMISLNGLFRSCWIF